MLTDATDFLWKSLENKLNKLLLSLRVTGWDHNDTEKRKKTHWLSLENVKETTWLFLKLITKGKNPSFILKESKVYFVFSILFVLQGYYILDESSVSL